MTGNSEYRLSGHTEAALLHDGRCHSHPLAGADGTGQLGRAGSMIPRVPCSGADRE
ncbi:hypothetical protein RHECNPAF_467004 [Rhizobium etli CNPAF512]|nr:hypothetical protein RHECNPAF_467004 [Rhizobium etli CNPAF512]